MIIFTGHAVSFIIKPYMRPFFNYWEGRKWSKEKIVVTVLVLVVLGGAFLRLHHFGDWLHFQLDQSRDALVIDQALAGSPLDLPLLGPKAGGTFLRLGPAYYYFQYASALVFGSGAAGQVMFVALFGIALIPLLYFYLRRGFSPWASLAGTALFSVSLYAILYSRFGWNPNLIPFFALGGFYFLLGAVEKEDPARERSLLIAVALLVIATQMHFLAFLALPVIAGLFLLLHWPRFRFKTWLAALLIALVLYLPMFLNETKTHFANTHEFFGAIVEKNDKAGGSHVLLDKVIRDIEEYGMADVIVLSGSESATAPKVETHRLWITSIVCKDKCDAGKWQGLAGTLFFLLGVFALLWLWYRETDGRRKSFWLLNVIWFGVSFFLFLPLAFDIVPRFYLLTLPLFFVLFLAPFQAFVLLTHRKCWAWGSLAVAVLVLAGLNLSFIKVRFIELAHAHTDNVESAPDRILKEPIPFTLEQQKEITSYILTLDHIHEHPLYFESVSRYKRALKYQLDKAGLATDGISTSVVYQEGVYVFVFPTGNAPEKTLGEDILARYSIKHMEPFGTLSAAVLEPRPDAITAVRESDMPPIESGGSSAAPKRYTWREYFTNGAGQADEATGADDEQ